VGFDGFVRSEIEAARRAAARREAEDPSARDLTRDHDKRLRPAHLPTDPTIKSLIVGRNKAFNAARHAERAGDVGYAAENQALVERYDQELVRLRYDPFTDMR
jgi:hypothetical protein